MNDWMDNAACRGVDTTLFFPPRGDVLEEVRLMCAVCPVRQRCLDEALADSSLLGYWGGTSAKQRHTMRHSLGIKEMSQCGTHAGYNRHLARGESTCEECRAAHTEYTTTRRRVRGVA